MVRNDQLRVKHNSELASHPRRPLQKRAAKRRSRVTTDSGMDGDEAPAYDLAHLTISEACLASLVESLKSCQLNAANTDGDTLLHIAAREGCQAAVEAILEAGADPLTRNKRNRTAATQAKLKPEVKQLLMDAETCAKDKKKSKDASLWNEKMRATQTESAFGVRVV